MSQSDLQCEFTYLLGRLIGFAESRGLKIVLKEAYRPTAWQFILFHGLDIVLNGDRIKVEGGRTKTKNSKHMEGVAADIVLFKADKKSLAEPEDYRVLGDYWKRLDYRCVWGGDWGWDSDHFQLTK